jgi:pilus assembly protein Flp/PilA
MLETLKNLRRDESGQDLIEYTLIAALLALGAVAGMKTVSGSIDTVFKGIETNLTGSLPQG